VLVVCVGMKAAAVKKKAPPKPWHVKRTISQELAAIIGLKTASKTQVLKRIWKYVKERKLQDEGKGISSVVHPDDKLAKVLGKNAINAFQMAVPLMKHVGYPAEKRAN